MKEKERVLVSRSVASIHDSLGPISKELLGRFISSRTRAFLVGLFGAGPMLEKDVGLCVFRESLRSNSSRSRCSLILVLYLKEEQGIEATN